MTHIIGMGYVVIGTTHIQRWRQFGVNVLGMAAVDAPDGSLRLKMDERSHRYLIVPHESDRVLASGWEVMDKEAFKTARAAAGENATDGSAEEAASRMVQQFFSLTDPAGNCIEVFWGPISDFERFVSPIGVEGFVTGDMGMGHIVLPAPTPHFDTSLDFWLTQMGFDVSDFVRYDMGADQPPVRIHFLHCDNPREHSVALVEMDNAAACDHLLVETTSIDEVGRALYRAEDNDVEMRVTLGRHINDEMISFYMYSPTGFLIEYGAGGKRIEDWSSKPMFESTRGSHWGHRFVSGTHSA